LPSECTFTQLTQISIDLKKDRAQPQKIVRMKADISETIKSEKLYSIDIDIEKLNKTKLTFEKMFSLVEYKCQV